MSPETPDSVNFDGDLVLGRYRLGPQLGRGSQGTTYLAWDEGAGQRVAIKVFELSRVEDWKELELFQRECEVLQELDHPGIPDYLDEVQDEDTGQFYLVMEYVPGRSLADVVKRDGALPEREIWSVLVQVVDILSHLHVRVPPIVHRDIKPGNLIRRPDGQVVLVDFGGVRNAFRPDGGSTVVGTFGYMAPEQLHGEATPATDLYALAATLLYLATGTEPEKLPRKGLRLKVEQALDDHSRELVALVDRLAEPDPDKRPQSAVDLAKELTTGVRAVPSAPEPEPLPLPTGGGPLALPSDLPWPITMVIGTLLILVSIGGTVALAAAEFVFIPLIFAVLLAMSSSDSKRDLQVRERAFKRGVRAARASLQSAARQSRAELFRSRRWGPPSRRSRRSPRRNESWRDRAVRDQEHRTQRQTRAQQVERRRR